MILAATGFVPQLPDGPVIAQTEEALNGILGIITIVPGAFGVLSIAALMFYRLDATTHARIVEELAERRRLP
jgi:Na+/melibiose symporter-like transporter